MSVADIINIISNVKNINKVKLKDVRNLSKLKGYSFVALVPY